MKVPELEKHPEGGSFQRIFLSEKQVINDNREPRQALSHIYFSLLENEISKFHMVKSDEIWNLYEGEELRLYIWDPDTENLDCITLSKTNREYCHVVPAGMWQAAKPVSGNILAGCSVGPGFDYKDFELITNRSHIAAKIINKYPELKEFC